MKNTTDIPVKANGSVTHKGVTYIQVNINESKIPINDDTCTQCIAYTNIILCDVICSQCKPRKVFITKISINRDTIMTEQFVTQNPTLVLIILGGACIIIKILADIISKFVTVPYNNLTNAITALTTEFTAYRKEVKRDREKDQKEIGFLLDRMQAQETLCEVTRNYCPHTSDKCVKLSHEDK